MLNKSLFKSLLLFVVFSLGTTRSFAQKVDFLIPDAVITQYAGSIGFFSLGASYDLFKKNTGYLDFMYGYVPASKGGELHAATIKFSYKMFEVNLGDWGKLYPFNPGLFLSYTFHDDLPLKFHTSEYPKGYYYWTPGLRPHVSFSSEIEFALNKTGETGGIKKIGLYTELNSNDFYLINYAQNTSALSLSDIFQLGIGIRLKF